MHRIRRLSTPRVSRVGRHSPVHGHLSHPVRRSREPTIQSHEPEPPQEHPEPSHHSLHDTHSRLFPKSPHSSHSSHSSHFPRFGHHEDSPTLKRVDSFTTPHNHHHLENLPESATERFKLVSEEMQEFVMKVLNYWSEEGDPGKIAETLGDWSDAFLNAISPKSAPSLHLKNEEEVRTILEKLEELKEHDVSEFFKDVGTLEISHHCQVDEVVKSLKLKAHSTDHGSEHHHGQDHHHSLSESSLSGNEEPIRREEDKKPHKQSRSARHIFSRSSKHHPLRISRRTPSHSTEKRESTHDKPHEDSHEKPHESSHEQAHHTPPTRSHHSESHTESDHHHDVHQPRSKFHGRIGSLLGRRRKEGVTHHSHSLSHDDFRINHRQAAQYNVATYGLAGGEGGLRLLPSSSRSSSLSI